MELKEALSILGIDVDAEKITGEVLLDAANKRFVVRENAFDDPEIRNKATGKVSAMTARNLISVFGLNDDEVKDKKVEEIASYANSRLLSKIESLESDSKKGRDEIIADWQNKYEKIKKELLEYKTVAESSQNAIRKQADEFVAKEKGWKLDSVFSKAKEKVSSEYHNQVKELELVGFEKKIFDTYNFDIGENDEVLIYNKTTKERVADTGKMGAFIGLEELLKKEANAAGLLKKTDGISQFTTKPNTQESGQNNNSLQTDIVNPNLSSAAKRRLAESQKK